MAIVEQGKAIPEEYTRKKSIYKEFSPGDSVSFTLHTLQLNGSVALADQQITIADIRGGGFFGKVIIPEAGNFVIKTSLPDPWHHLWRTINWKLADFPAQSDELSAQLEHLGSYLIHKVVPVLTFGKIYSPDSLGYTKLSTGYAQVVEKIEGRGPRFDAGVNEYEGFRKVQQELSWLALNLGLEQAGQIHPDNPFGMANIWFDEKNKRWIWLDTIPAIPHSGFVLPAFYFRFHKDLRQWFYQEEQTFNRIHTGYFLTELKRNRELFSDEEYKNLVEECYLYEHLWQEREARGLSPHRSIDSVGGAFQELAKDTIGERLIFKLLSDPAFRIEKIDTLVRVVKDSQYRIFFFNKNFVMKGVEKAFAAGYLTKEEWVKAWEEVNNEQEGGSGTNHKEKAVWTGLQAYYLISGSIANAIEASTYATAIFEEDKIARLIFGFIVGRVLPLLLRPTGTMATSLATNTDLRVATITSIIPLLGSYLAIPAQIGVSSSNKTDLVWHYTVRNIISKLSQLSPAGGLGTQLEAELWEKVGRYVERLGRRTKINRY